MPSPIAHAIQATRLVSRRNARKAPRVENATASSMKVKLSDAGRLLMGTVAGMIELRYIATASNPTDRAREPQARI